LRSTAAELSRTIADVAKAGPKQTAGNPGNGNGNKPTEKPNSSNSSNGKAAKPNGNPNGNPGDDADPAIVGGGVGGEAELGPLEAEGRVGARLKARNSSTNNKPAARGRRWI
jgi:hypothetical protein